MKMTWNKPELVAVTLQPLTGQCRCPVCKVTQPAGEVKQDTGATMELLTCSKCGQQSPRKYWRISE